MSITKLKTLISILFPILLASCQEGTYFHTYQAVNNNGWYRSDTLSYILPTAVAVDVPLSFEIGIRHKDSYPYRDLWLTINGDTCHLFLADTIGKWSGNGIGEIRHVTHSIPFQNKKDSLKMLKITHIMQDEPLKGIHDIGIYIREKD